MPPSCHQMVRPSAPVALKRSLEGATEAEGRRFDPDPGHHWNSSDFWLSGRRRNALKMSVDALDVGHMPCPLGKGQRSAELTGCLVDIPFFSAIQK